MKKETYCNKTSCYFIPRNLRLLYGLYNEKISFDLTQHIRRTVETGPYGKLWKNLRTTNSNLYSQIRSVAESKTDILGDIETKMFFITGRQYYSDLNKLTIDQISKMLSVINMLLRKEIGNPQVRPRIWDPKWMTNKGELYFSNSHNIGNLRTGLNHLINENIIEITWAQFVNNDFVEAEIKFSRNQLWQYYNKVKSYLSGTDLIQKTDKEFGFERILRDVIRSDLRGIEIDSEVIPEFQDYFHYPHHEFETDAVGETPDQRWIFEFSTGHKSCSEILNKYYIRKNHFNITRGEKRTIGLFIVSNCSLLKNTSDKVIVLRISEFVQLLKDNNIRDTISCFGFK